MSTFDDEAGNSLSLSLLKEEVASSVLSTALNFPAVNHNGYEAECNLITGEGLETPTDEMIKQFRKSSAMQQLSSLLEQAHSQRGIDAAMEVAGIARIFFKFSGTIYRLRARDLESQNPAKSHEKSFLNHVPVFLPSYITLWDKPLFSSDEKLDGRNSMETADREQLIDCAILFYRTGDEQTTG